MIGFVTNASWLDGNSHDGFRKCIEEDFSKIYVFDLRGNQRTSGELSRKEGGKIFGSGSRAPIAITFLVKNPSKNKEKGDISYYDVGNYLSRDDKLNILSNFSSISNKEIQWKKIKPNEHGDWLSKRKETFGNFISIEPENKFNHETEAFFNTYAIGISTNRDTWVYNSSKDRLQSIIPPMIKFYNSQRNIGVKKLQKNDDLSVSDVVDNDPKRISWTAKLRRRLKNDKTINYNKDAFRKSLYRPFFKQYLYFDKDLIERPGLYDRFYPNKTKDNKTIVVSGPGANKGFSCLITDSMTNMDCIQKGQGFPLYHFKEEKIEDPSLFDKKGEKLVRKDGVSDFILNQASKRYSDRVTKKDIFYYMYGLLHSKKYRSQFKDSLKRTLPKMPLVDKPKDFWAFSKSGKDLANLHLNYESVDAYEDVDVIGADAGLFKVEKLRFGDDKSTITYNSKIKITNIPEKAYEYEVNGRSAIEWLMDRYKVKVDKKSGIKNDPNDWAEEVGKPRYILDLLLSVINVSVQTGDIVNDLPDVDFENL